MKRVLTWCVGVCVAAVPAMAMAADRPVDIPARSKKSQAIVVATVTSVENGRFDTNPFGDQIIVTRAWLRVDEVVKGQASQVVALDIEGGSVGDLTLKVSDMPVMATGERGVFFLDLSASGAHVPNGRGHGVLKVERDGRVANSQLTLEGLKGQIRAALR